MAISPVLVASNDRALLYSYTGDGATVASTMTFPQRLDPSLAVATATLISYAAGTVPTTEVTSASGGLYLPTQSGATVHTVSSASINVSTGVVTVTPSAAVAINRPAFALVTFNHEAN